MSDEKQESIDCLLKLQIGPVQEFIAQARSTRDLWSGSFLLSWLIAVGLHQLEGCKAKIIYPAWNEQPLGKLRNHEQVDFVKALVPNLPNVLLAEVSGHNAAQLAAPIVKEIRDEWEKIASVVWDFCENKGLKLVSTRDRYDAQVQRFLSIAWQVTPREEIFAGVWSKWTMANGRQLDAIRHTRDFIAWNEGGWSVGRMNNKDSLNGRDEAIAGGPGWRDTLPAELKPLFKHDDWIGAVTLIKRLWHCAYLQADPWNVPARYFKMPNTCGIAAHDPSAQIKPQLHDEDDAPSEEELSASEKHFAVLAFDGDKMGEYIHTLHSGDEHTRFSSALGNFSRDQVSPVVAKHCGRVIYAGGDDVLALLPADTALSCAQALREEFHRTMPSGLDASVGIAIAHFKTPLQDIVRAAQMAERRAKNQLNRSAVAVTLYKRSGETVEWGTNWQSGGLELYDALAAALKNDHVSVKFPQRVVELLAPYLSEQTGLVKTVPSPEFENVVDEIMQREFAAVCDRQCKPAWKREVSETISPLLKKYISHLKGAETKLRDIIGLCQTVAFAHRIRDNDAEHEPGTQVTAERQPV